jgi:para-aminobenzoate synthetase component 1
MVILFLLYNFAAELIVLAMTKKFPYILLNKSQLIRQINQLASACSPFLFIIDFKAETGYIFPQEELDKNFVQFDFQNRESGTKSQEPRVKNQEMNVNWDIQAVCLEDYQQKFNYVQQQIHRGNSFLTNLTQPTKVETNLSLLQIFQQSSAKYKLWVKDCFTVLSPETFIKIQGRTISSFPMKGTIDAEIPNAEAHILNDPKESAEHATIVDLIRNDLSMVAENVEVKRYRYVEKLKTNQKDLLQVSSEITGQLPENFHNKLGEIIFSLLPAGSISGAPKSKTLEIIEHAECYDRGFYTGICGWFDGENLDSAVMIRFIEQQGDQLVYKSGGGITSKSDVKKEYEELIQKVYVPLY